ncbi:MAG: hypothetical protein RLZZ337_406 [Bacteroidota bacterium]
MTFNNLAAFLLVFILQCSSAFAQNIDIKNISISGNKRTKDFVILRELLFSKESKIPIDSFDLVLSMSKNRVMNLNLFNSVEIDTIPSDTGCNIHITLVEKWYNWPIPFIEFSDRNFNVWKDLSFDPERTNYGLYLFNYNVFGRNHTIKTSLVYGYNKTYGLEYRIPFLSKNSNLGLSSKLKYTSQSEMWLETKNDKLQFYKNGRSNLIDKTIGELKLSKRIKPYTMVFAEANVTHIKLDSSLINIASHYLLNNVLERTSLEMGLSIATDTRNNIYLPTSGNFLSANTKFQYFTGSLPIYNIYTTAKIQQFKQLKTRWYSALSLFGDLNSSYTLPYENTRRFGYSNLVRGFEAYVVEGRASALANAALRFEIVEQKKVNLPFIHIKNYNFLPLVSYLELFVDAGSVSNSNSLIYNNLTNKLLYSTGLSLQTIFYNDRILRLEYSLNSLKESGFFVHFNKAI